MIKKAVKKLIPNWVLEIIKNKKERKLLLEWKVSNCPIPPPHFVKQMIINEYREKYNYNILVETGTYLGDMVEAQKKHFKKIYSIELGSDLFEKAKNRFKNDKNVTIIQGDSGKVLPHILSNIDEPSIFWLDGHYSAGMTAKGDKECPIFEELDSIFKSKNMEHVFLIDDARCFTGEGDYPSIEALTEYIKGKNNKYQVKILHDIIRFTI